MTRKSKRSPPKNDSWTRWSRGALRGPAAAAADPAASAAAARIKIPGTLSPKGMGGNTSTSVKASWGPPDNQIGTFF